MFSITFGLAKSYSQNLPIVSVPDSVLRISRQSIVIWAMVFVFVIENPSYWDQFFPQHHQHRFKALTVSKPSKITSNHFAYHVLFFSSVLQLLNSGAQQPAPIDSDFLSRSASTLSASRIRPHMWRVPVHLNDGHGPCV